MPRNSLFSASALSANDGLAFIALPYGPGCFWSARSLITDLVAEVEHIQPEALPKVFNARRVDLPISYKTPPQGEEHYCRVTLDEICSAIAVGASLLTSQRVSVVQASQVGNKIDFFCASRRTSPEPVIMYEWNGFSVGLIASEAKRVDASLYECMCQAVQMASDCALSMLQFLQSEDIVVPYVTSAGFSVQFGAVYLMKESYPCAVTLSEELSVLNMAQVKRINQWIGALSSFCGRMIQRIHSAMDERSGNKRLAQTQSMIRLAIDESYLLKPIVALQAKYATSLSNYLLHLYYKLWHSSAQQYVQFPVGVMAYPHSREVGLANYIKSKFRIIAERGNKDAEYYESIVSDAGHPIFVYEDLSLQSVWREASRMLDEADTSQELITMFVAVLKEALQAIAAAGVIHMDLRLSNIFYRVVQYEHDAASGVQSSRVEVRIIDWDDSLLIGEIVDKSLYDKMRGDHRYPQGECFKKAIPQYHEEFFGMIEKELFPQMSELGKRKHGSTLSDVLSSSR